MHCIDGREIRDKVGEELKHKIQETRIVPSLGILCVGSDPASLSFINVKKKFGEKYGFKVCISNLDGDTSKEEIIHLLENMQATNDSVLLQLPLPPKFKDDADQILKTINSLKDVDNLCGQSYVGDYYTSPMILSLKKVLDFTDKSVLSKRFAVVGFGQVVGKPVSEFLKELRVEVETIDENNHERIKTCDVVISGVGVQHLIKKEYIKSGSILIDYGCSYKKIEGRDVLCGDFHPECLALSSMYTPVPGGMGPIVVACLFENVFKATTLRGK